MSAKNEQFKVIFLLSSVLLMGVILLVGCKKKSEPAAQPKVEEVASVAIEQTTCPVMGGAINESIFTEYQGKKVYFCCAGCKEKFEKEPEKYMAKLPQFKD
jgi:YHS domain-containing protein